MAGMVRLDGTVEFMVNPGKGALARFLPAAYVAMHESCFRTQKVFYTQTG